MSVCLLSTKIHIPPLRINHVSRSRLTENLVAGVQRPGSFVLIYGPAGFGKTTLLSEFVAQFEVPVAWVALDEGDNDAVRFSKYVKTACQSIQQEIGASALAQVHSPQPLPDETVPTIFIVVLL